jgi:hypothetical protein
MEATHSQGEVSDAVFSVEQYFKSQSAAMAVAIMEHTASNVAKPGKAFLGAVDMGAFEVWFSGKRRYWCPTRIGLRGHSGVTEYRLCLQLFRLHT